MSRRTVTIAAVTLVALLVVWKSMYIVRPDQVVVVTKFGDPLRIGTEKRVLVNEVEIPGFELDGTDLCYEAANLNSKSLPEIFPRNRSGRHSHRGLARRRAAAAAVISNTVFLLVSVICVTGTKTVHDITVIFGTLIRIFDNQTNTDGYSG